MSKIKLQGRLDKSSNCLIYYWAPRSVEKKYSSLSFPYPNKDIAYDKSMNIGVTTCDNNGIFEIELDNPCEFYDNSGKVVKPHVNISSEQNPDKHITIFIDDPYNYIIN